MNISRVLAIFGATILVASTVAEAASDQAVLELLPLEARASVAAQLAKAGDNASALGRAIAEAPPEQREAVGFLIANMPDSDLSTLTADFLLANVRLAYMARNATSWAREIPRELFFEYVLPYASVNERRDDWRKDFHDRFAPVARESNSAAEAVKRLNVEVFKMLNVAYHATKRPKPDQSPYESIKAGFASCTGLSILLIDACRAVGVPARMVGTPLWTDGSGNHTWVEVWDHEWSFVGACEPSKLNETWFLEKASKADETSPEHRIYATSFKKTETHFPMVWKRSARDVPADDVTRRYTMRRKVAFRSPGAPGVISVRLDGRLVASARIADSTTFELPGDLAYEVRVQKEGGGEIVQTIHVSAEPEQIVEIQGDAGATSAVDPARSKAVVEALAADEELTAEQAATPLTKADAAQALDVLVRRRAAAVRADREAEVRDRRIKLGELEMPFFYKVFGEKPKGGRSLFLSMHGGGGAPVEVNDRQYENQKTLYAPAEGVYLAPRAPTNTWDLWHQAHIDAFLERLIEDMVVFEDVSRDRVYLMGYSAGGDGVYQVAPRMADRFAAASMMAGHPNEASPLGLRNLPFAIHVGADDAAYNRNTVAREWGDKLDALRKGDPQGYVHLVEIHPGRGHWMNREDASAVPWMAQFHRNPAPSKVVWRQDDVTRDRFYWLAVEPGRAKAGATVIASIEGQEVRIESAEGVETLIVRLDDRLLDLDRPVKVVAQSRTLFEGIAPRTVASLKKSLEGPGDPGLAFAAEAVVKLLP